MNCISALLQKTIICIGQPSVIMDEVIEKKYIPPLLSD
jgi:hypothetical protein